MLRFDGVTLRRGHFVLERVDFQVGPGDYCALMGRTGSGKTSILEAAAGLARIEAGHVRIANNDVTHSPPALREIGYVPQDGALFEHLSVARHLGFALELRRWSQKDIESRVAELGAWLGIEQLLSRKPQGLSGGERQRVALGRALAFHPRILLLDEPLSALDDETRDGMYELLDRIYQETRVTVLHITHRAAEAARLATRVLRLEDGSLREEELTDCGAL